MHKCYLCPRLIDPDDETVRYKPRPDESPRKRLAHLSCYLDMLLKAVVDRPCFPSDPVVVHVEELCQWCRLPGITAGMGRTGQRICINCLEKLKIMFVAFLAKNNLDGS